MSDDDDDDDGIEDDQVQDLFSQARQHVIKQNTIGHASKVSLNDRQRDITTDQHVTHLSSPSKIKEHNYEDDDDEQESPDFQSKYMIPHHSR